MSQRIKSYFTIISLILSLYPVQNLFHLPKSYAQGNKEQNQQKKDEVIRLDTELVQLDVVVVGKDGKPVRDLSRESFELLEDGKIQQITHFAAGTAEKPASWLRTNKAKKVTFPAVAPMEMPVTGTERFFVFAVDDYHIAPENLLNAKRVLKQFVKEQMIGGDQIALITTSGTIGLFQQFTDDREVLDRAIDRLNVQTRKAANSMDIPRISEYQAELIERNDSDALQLAVEELRREMPPPTPAGGMGGGGRRGGGMSLETSSDNYESQVRSKARMITAQSTSYTRATLSTLEGVVRTLNEVQGRKIMVLLSDGFLLNHGNGDSRIYDIRKITDAATRAGVTIYSLDSRGLTTGMDITDRGSSAFTTMPGVRERLDSSSMSALRDGMGIIADDTGGFLITNSNDLNAGLQKVLDNNNAYYVLAFEPEVSRKDGRFHKIEVRVIDRPDLTVKTRKGYYSSLIKDDEKIEVKNNNTKKNKDKTPPPNPKAVRTRLGLTSLFTLKEIPVGLTVNFMHYPDKGNMLLVNSHIGASFLDFKDNVDKRHNNSSELTFILINEKGAIVNSFTRKLDLNLSEENYKKVIEGGLQYTHSLELKDLPHGFYQARVSLVEDGSLKLGSASDWVEIPDLRKKELMLSSIVLIDNGSRIFKSGSRVDFQVFAYNAKFDKKLPPDVIVQSQVFRGGKLVYASPFGKMGTVTDAQNQLGYAAQVSFNGFEQGAYELRLTAIDRANKTTANRSVTFKVN